MRKQILSIILFIPLLTIYSVAQNNAMDSAPNRTIDANKLTSKHVAHDHADHQNDEGNFGEQCLQKSKTEALKNTSDQYRLGWEAARELTWRIAEEIENGVRATPPVYTIPVVFHVIHKGETIGNVTNISSAQVQSAVDALNRDYRRTSADGGIALGAGPDTEIQFCLAGVDPNGSPHSGINRVNGTGVSGYSANGITNSNESSVKALSRWDNRYYMNVWVVSEIDGNGADVSNVNNFFGGTIGYAYQPTNPVTWNSDLDGIVILNLSVGNDPTGSNGYRLWGGGETNRTLTHEVGHFLALDHTFEGNSCSESNCSTQGDQICDTPPTVQGSTCNNPACNNTQVENYMDYTSESCQDQFTNGQSTVMRGVLAGVRNALVNTGNCGSSSDYDAGISAIITPNGALCTTTFEPIVTLNNYASTTLTSVQIQYYVDANGPSTFNWSGSLASNSSTNVTLPSVTSTAGAHTFTATTVSGSLNTNNTDEELGNDEATSNFNIGSGGSSITLTLDLDCFGDEITWEIRNASSQVVASGGPYVNNSNGEQIIEGLCLAEGCYDFIISDTYGDGLYGSQWQTCSIDGDYNISDGSTTLVEMTAANSDFGNGATHNFCIGGGGSVSCEDLLTIDGQFYDINPADESLFTTAFTDVDGETVNSAIIANGFNGNWQIAPEEVAPGDTNWFVIVTSYHENTSAPADNWLTFGPVTMTSDGGEIRWKHRYVDNLYRDGYELLVNTTGGAIANFNSATTLYSVTDNDPSTDGETSWVEKTVALPSGTYANQPLYFAFHHTALDMYLLLIDDIIVEGCTGTITAIDNVQENFELKVFPNPSSDNFMFQYQTDSNENLNFSMLNALGQEVWSGNNAASNNSVQVIETSGLGSGVYTLVVRGEHFNISERLILTK